MSASADHKDSKIVTEQINFRTILHILKGVRKDIISTQNEAKMVIDLHGGNAGNEMKAAVDAQNAKNFRKAIELIDALGNEMDKRRKEKKEKEGTEELSPEQMKNYSASLNKLHNEITKILGEALKEDTLKPLAKFSERFEKQVEQNTAPKTTTIEYKKG